MSYPRKERFEAACSKFVDAWHRAGLHRLDSPGAMRRALAMLDLPGSKIPPNVVTRGRELRHAIEEVRRSRPAIYSNRGVLRPSRGSEADA
jgi:hypothetical protein